MKKRMKSILALLLAGVMAVGLFGCIRGGDTAVTTAEEETKEAVTTGEIEETTPEETTPEETEYHAFCPEDYEKVDGRDDLYDLSDMIAKAGSEDMTYFMRMDTDKIVFVEYVPTEEGGARERYRVYDFKEQKQVGVLDVEDGMVCFLGKYFTVWKSEKNEVTIYNSDLEVVGTYSIADTEEDVNYIYFYCGDTLDTMYAVCDHLVKVEFDGDVMKLNRMDCPVGIPYITAVSADGKRLDINGIDRETLKDVYYHWDIVTNELESYEIVEIDDWVKANALDAEKYDFMSHIALEDENLYLIQALTTDTYEQKIFLWDASATLEAGILPPETNEKEEPEYSIVHNERTMQDRLQYVYDLADDFYKRYGVKFYIADEVPTTIAEFSITQVTDPEVIETCMAEIDNIFSRYPEGFFEQLKFADINHFDIYLASEIMGNGVDTVTQAGGFVTQDMDTKVMVLDTDEYFNYADTVNHELFHMMESRMLRYSYTIDTDGFDEDAYNALNPEGFTYFNTYEAFNDNRASDLYWSDEAISNSFIKDYSLTYASEDRAVLFGTTMYIYFNNAYYMQNLSEDTVLGKKLSFLCQGIRKCFNTEGWPEELPWEEVLRKSTTGEYEQIDGGY